MKQYENDSIEQNKLLYEKWIIFKNILDFFDRILLRIQWGVVKLQYLEHLDFLKTFDKIP